MNNELSVCLMAAAIWAMGSSAVAEGAPLGLLDGATVTATSPQEVKVIRMTGHLRADIVQAEGGEYPGIVLAPKAPRQVWDLSEATGITARVKNPSTTPVTLTLRVDNPGNWEDNPWNAESIEIAPGEEADLAVAFGKSYGGQPGYPVDPSQISQIMFFTDNAETAWHAFQVMQISPVGGQAGARFYGSTDGRKEVELLSESWTVDLPADRPESEARTFACDWDLRQFTHVRVVLANTGKVSITPAVRLHSAHGSSDRIVATKSIGPGRTAFVYVPFAVGQTHVWQTTLQPDIGFDSRRISAVAIDAAATLSAPGQLQVQGVQALASLLPVEPASAMPPVPGDWQLTLEENFDGDAPNYDVWSTHTDNYWDARTTFSDRNVIVENGYARLRIEAAPGHDGKFMSGFLDTYGKWTQRYGYFEARMQLPKAAGLWPAFWMMPDRGRGAGDRGAREDTLDGGMEFDIVEHLTGWGPFRYNVAYHWDGYADTHKSLSHSEIYAQLDEAGFITAGLLWLPGEATYYCNGLPVASFKHPRVCDVPSLIRFTNITGGWDNTKANPIDLPADFVIDYVRCWQRKDLIQ